MNEGVRGISRRRFLQGISGMVGGLGLAACEIGAYPPATPPPVERVTAVPAPTRRPYVVPVEVELTIGSFAGPEMQVFRELLRRFHSYYPGIRIRLDVAKVESQRAWAACRWPRNRRSAGCWAAPGVCGRTRFQQIARLR